MGAYIKAKHRVSRNIENNPQIILNPNGINRSPSHC